MTKREIGQVVCFVHSSDFVETSKNGMKSFSRTWDTIIITEYFYNIVPRFIPK